MLVVFFIMHKGSPKTSQRQNKFQRLPNQVNSAAKHIQICNFQNKQTPVAVSHFPPRAFLLSTRILSLKMLSLLSLRLIPSFSARILRLQVAKTPSTYAQTRSFLTTTRWAFPAAKAKAAAKAAPKTKAKKATSTTTKAKAKPQTKAKAKPKARPKPKKAAPKKSMARHLFEGLLINILLLFRESDCEGGSRQILYAASKHVGIQRP